MMACEKSSTFTETKNIKIIRIKFWRNVNLNSTTSEILLEINNGLLDI